MFIVDYFTNLSHALATFLLAMIPIAEYRVALPVALEIYGLSFWTAFWLAVAGSVVPAFLVLILIEPAAGLARKYFQPVKRFLEWLFKHTRDRHQKKFATYKDLLIILLVAVPIPLTGVYTGALAAYVFGIPFRRAFPLIVLSVIIGTLIIAGLTLGFRNIF